jgi:hypothetical protein
MVFKNARIAENGGKTPIQEVWNSPKIGLSRLEGKLFLIQRCEHNQDGMGFPDTFKPIMRCSIHPLATMPLLSYAWVEIPFEVITGSK